MKCQCQNVMEELRRLRHALAEARSRLMLYERERAVSGDDFEARYSSSVRTRLYVYSRDACDGHVKP